MKHSTLVFPLILAKSVFCQGLAVPHYRLLDFGPATTTPYDALAISNTGVVTGSFYPSNCFRYSVIGQFELLPKGTWYNFYQSSGVNSLGWIIGLGNNSMGVRGFLWTGYGPVIDLCTMLGTDYLDPKGINDLGEICGTGYFPTYRSFIWSIKDGFRWYFNGTAQGFNSYHEVVGAGTDSQGYPNFAYWSATGDFTMPGSPPGSYQSSGIGINDQHVSVVNGIGSVNWFCFTWTLGSGYKLVPPLRDTDFMQAKDINDLGWIVGQWADYDVMDVRPFIYIPGVGTRTLTDLIDPASMKDWVLTNARGINNSGEICGSGKYKGVDRGFRLVPLNPIRAVGVDIR